MKVVDRDVRFLMALVSTLLGIYNLNYNQNTVPGHVAFFMRSSTQPFQWIPKPLAKLYGV